MIQRLDDEHSLVLAPYMLNSAELLTGLGFSARVLEEGFNNKNKHPREAPFNGETLKHVLLSSKADRLIKWFNTDWNQLMKAQELLKIQKKRYVTATRLSGFRRSLIARE